MTFAADLGVYKLGVTFDFISPYILFSHRTRNPSRPKSKWNVTHQRPKEKTAGAARRRVLSKQTQTRVHPRRCLEWRARSPKMTTSRTAKRILGRCCGGKKNKNGPSNKEGKRSHQPHARSGESVFISNLTFLHVKRNLSCPKDTHVALNR